MRSIVSLLTICMPFLLHAQGFQVSLQGQKQQAMAGAGTGFITDGAALFYNPGGVAFLKDNSFSAGVTPVFAHSKYADAASSTVSSTESPASFPFTTYLVLGKKASKLKYGLAVYTPFGSTIDWQNDWTGRFALTRITLATIYFQPTISYKISEKFGIGAGFVYGYGQVNLQRDLPISDDKGGFANAELKGSGSGIGYNAGIYYRPIEKLSFGLTYRSGVEMEVKKGTATFTVPSSLAASFPSGDFSSTLPLPKVITLGIGFNPCSKLAVAIDASHVGWKTFDTLMFDYAQNTNELQDTKSPRHYDNAMAFRVGAQYSASEKFAVRAGIKYLGTPVKDGYVSPDVPDQAHINYSAGFGYRLKPGFTIDMSVTYQSMKRSDTNIETQMNGTYKTNIVMPGISFNYNF